MVLSSGIIEVYGLKKESMFNFYFL